MKVVLPNWAMSGPEESFDAMAGAAGLFGVRLRQEGSKDLQLRHPYRLIK